MLTPMPKIRLLNPGPVTLTDGVRGALLGPDLCHRQPEFSALMQDVRQRLARVYPTCGGQWTAVLLTGSGTAAVEAMLGSLTPRDGASLVVCNGVYGERMAKILQRQGKRYETVGREWTAPIDLDAVARALDAASFSHVLAVHHETTTGRMNDIAALGDLCARRGVPLLLDAVSSFGGEPIDFADGAIAACAVTANKCLHGVPGISFVLVQERLLQNGVTASASLYLDLFAQYAAQSRGGTPFTPAVQVLYALGQALVEFEAAGGWAPRHASYMALSCRLRAGLRSLGLRPLLDENAYASTLTSFHLPPRVAFLELYQRLQERGFVIYPGQQALDGKIFRIAVMGDLTAADIDELIQAIAEIIGRAGGTPA
jgi:2-aminoethylphosphonate-pyruvate transaminase